MRNNSGILDRYLSESPVAVIDFETAGLTPGVDRVVKISVVRVDPGEEPRRVLDTLVNPALIIQPSKTSKIQWILAP